MLVTARSNTGPMDDRGVIGHARSDDLITWTVQPPLTTPGHGFGYLEVPQVQVVDGHAVLIFNCDRGHLAAGRAASGEPGGVWVAPISSITGPYNVGQATRLAEQPLYVGKLVQDPQNNWVLLAFVEKDEHGSFGGYLINPRPVYWDGEVPRVDADQESAH